MYRIFLLKPDLPDVVWFVFLVSSHFMWVKGCIGNMGHGTRYF